MCEASNRWFENKALEELVSFDGVMSKDNSVLKSLYVFFCFFRCWIREVIREWSKPQKPIRSLMIFSQICRSLTYHILLATQHFRKYRVYNLNHEKNPTITFLNPKDLQNPARHWSLQMLIGLSGSSSSWVLPAFLSSSWLSARRSWPGRRGLRDGFSIDDGRLTFYIACFFLACLERGETE